MFLSYLILETQFLQRDADFDAIGCLARVESDVGLGSHIGGLSKSRDG